MDQQATGASGTRLKVATRPAAVGTTWLDLFHPGTPSELSLEARLRVIADVAGALIQIHENTGVPRPHRRHGRITPRHVLISVDGSASLFHVKEPFSRLLPPQPDLGYLAPELLTQSAPASQQSDVFSLGVLLWEALDNGRLFPHRRAAAISRLSTRSLPAPRAQEEWALPLSEVAQRALAHDPADRHADATSFWLALREYLPAPDAARAQLSRLVQLALKLELTSEIRQSPPYLVRGSVPGSLYVADAPAEGAGEADAGAPARYSLRPEPSRRHSSSAARSSAPVAPNPAWMLSDPPPPASRPSAGPPPSSGPGAASPQGRPSSRAPTPEPSISRLQLNLQRELMDSSLPFLLASPPAPRPFPWGALIFAALVFFGVGAAVAFGAVTALRAQRADIVVRERTIIEPPPTAAREVPQEAATPTAATPIPPARAEEAPVPVAAPAMAPSAPPTASSSRAAERPAEVKRRSPRRGAKASRQKRPASVPRADERSRPDGKADDVESLPFVEQPY